MGKLRKFLKRLKDRNNSDGFTMLEMSITIPMLLLVAGVVVFAMVKSLLIMNDNNMTISAGNSIQKVVDSLQNLDSCYDLESTLDDSDFWGVSENKEFTISHEATECVPGETMTIHIEANRATTSKILFQTTIKKFISE